MVGLTTWWLRDATRPWSHVTALTPSIDSWGSREPVFRFERSSRQLLSLSGAGTFLFWFISKFYFTTATPRKHVKRLLWSEDWAAPLWRVWKRTSGGNICPEPVHRPDEAGLRRRPDAHGAASEMPLLWMPSEPARRDSNNRDQAWWLCIRPLLPMPQQDVWAVLWLIQRVSPEVLPTLPSTLSTLQPLSSPTL